MTKETIEHMIKLHEGAIAMLRKELGAKTRTKQMGKVISKAATTKRFQWNPQMPEVGGTFEIKTINEDTVTTHREPGSEDYWIFVRSDIQIFTEEEVVESEPLMTVS